jgi:hypothetical protein
MTRIKAVLLMTALIVLTGAAEAHGGGLATNDRPAGVPQSAWIAISKTFGFAVAKSLPATHAPGLENEQLPAASGYFAVRHQGHWLRLDLIGHVLPMARSQPAPVSVSKNLHFLALWTRGPTALGYFTVKRGRRWVRLVPITPGALFRGPLTSNRDPGARKQISTNLDFIIDGRAPQRLVFPQGDNRIPSVLGDFAVRHSGTWLRLEALGG